MTSYTRHTTTDSERQPVSIQSVDTVNRTCTVYTRTQYLIQNVDIAYSIGETTVVPAIGEQWYIERFDKVWRLYGRIPFNDPTLLTEAVEGQVSVGGGRGPVELHGTSVNAHGPVVLSTTRPDAAAAGVGAMIYDPDLLKPIWSNGTVWHDATGTTV